MNIRVIGKKVRKLRKVYGISRNTLATISGVSPRTIGRLESVDSSILGYTPKLSTYKAVVNSFGMSISNFERLHTKDVHMSSRGLVAQHQV